MDEKSNLCQLHLGRLFAIRGDAGVTAGPSWSQNCSSFTLLQVFQVQMFSNVRVLPTEKVVRYKTSLICNRLRNEIFSDPFLRENKNGEKKPPSSVIIAFRPI
jgi:hypothetical protein